MNLVLILLSYIKNNIDYLLFIVILCDKTIKQQFTYIFIYCLRDPPARVFL